MTREERRVQLDALTGHQKDLVLYFLSGLVPDAVDEALRGVAAISQAAAQVTEARDG